GAELLDRFLPPSLERVAEREPEPRLAEARGVGVLVDHAMEVGAGGAGKLELEVEMPGVGQLRREPGPGLGRPPPTFAVAPVPGIARQVVLPLIERLDGELLIEVLRSRLAEQRRPEMERGGARRVALGILAQHAFELHLRRGPLFDAEVAFTQAVDRLVHVP